MSETAFPTDIVQIKERLSSIQPDLYGRTRNFKMGAVTRLSPYISRGVISTRQLYDYIMTMELPWHRVEKLVQELAWRDFWQLVWLAKGDGINDDIRRGQTPVDNFENPEAIVKATTGIEAVDEAIGDLYKTGYMHNHMRMYVAAICCNIARSHWRVPGQWMYAHLLDGDLASNQLSWQWVAGTFSNKKYYANQDNINKYFNSHQKDTFLDVDYSEFETLKVPDVLRSTVPLDLNDTLPKIERPVLERERSTLIYNYYNLDPEWHAGENMQRVLLLEPSIFRQYPVSRRCIDFTLALAKNIPGIKIFIGEFDELYDELDRGMIIYKEHPLNGHYKGQEEPRDWMTSVKGDFSSFFSFWKKAQKELRP